MTEFCQSSGSVTTFHLNRADGPSLRDRLRERSRHETTALIVPCLASEFTEKENLPTFENILRELRRADYLDHVIIGLDRGTAADVALLRRLINRFGPQNCRIQWNDGPGFSGVYRSLSEAGFPIDEPGKGRNMFMGIGVALALGANSVAVVDADIRSFRCEQVDRLLFPVVALDYEFSKAFYARYTDVAVFGRVKRLLLDPLLYALERKFRESQDEKVLRLVDYLLEYRYQLSGEVAFRSDLLPRMRFATNWAVEIYSLVEAYRKATAVAQVDITNRPFEHKHQTVKTGNELGGLYRMAVDIVSTLMYTLIVEEGLEITDTFFRDLSITYRAVAENMIKKYADDASFNGLAYDRDREDELVRTVFKDAILVAGDTITAPHRLTERFLRFVTSNDEFRRFTDQGLTDTILEVERTAGKTFFEMPQTVSWERVQSRMPGILAHLRDLILEENGVTKAVGPSSLVAVP
jgi:glucosyl-3-phosphoglycerate synthase